MSESLVSLELPTDDQRRRVLSFCEAHLSQSDQTLPLDDSNVVRIFIEGANCALGTGQRFTAPDGTPKILWKDIDLDADGTFHKTISIEPAEEVVTLPPEIANDISSAIILGLLELHHEEEVDEVIASTRYGVYTEDELDQLKVTASELDDVLNAVSIAVTR